MEMIIMLLVLAGITAGVLYWDELRPPSVVQIQSSAQAPISSSWAEWVTYLQSFLGLGTLFIAFLIWYAETNDNWENNLPKRMSIFFFYDEHPVIVCRCVWLASAGDLRAWGQQVAAQAAGKRLDFSPDIKALQPHPVIWPAGTVCNHYAVRFNLTRHPFGTENFGICLYQNMASDKKGVYPIPVSRIETLSAVNEWQSGAKKM
jgi:hypothetical protein